MGNNFLHPKPNPVVQTPPIVAQFNSAVVFDLFTFLHFLFLTQQEKGNFLCNLALQGGHSL